MHSDDNVLIKYKEEINKFLKRSLDIEIHTSKSKITLFGNRLEFLGFTVFYYHRLLKKPNLRRMKANFEMLKKGYKDKKLDYDEIYDFLGGGLHMQSTQRHIN